MTQVEFVVINREVSKGKHLFILFIADSLEEMLLSIVA